MDDININTKQDDLPQGFRTAAPILSGNRCMYCDYRCSQCPDRLDCLNLGAEERSRYNLHQMIKFVKGDE